MSVQVRRSDSRGREDLAGRSTRHSFSFGAEYDPDNVSFGPLVCHNDDLLQPAVGYPEHPHSDTEIVTWVLSGVLVHTDSLGHRSLLTPGTVQVQSTGSGIVHSEVADPASGPTRFVQSWLRPDEWDLSPVRHLTRVEPPTLRDVWLTLVGGPDGLPVASRGARFAVSRPAAGWRTTLPDAGRVHLFVASGRVRVGEGVGAVELGPGDAVRVLDDPQTPLLALTDSELLAWSF